MASHVSSSGVSGGAHVTLDLNSQRQTTGTLGGMQVAVIDPVDQLTPALSTLTPVQIQQQVYLASTARALAALEYLTVDGGGQSKVQLEESLARGILSPEIDLELHNKIMAVVRDSTQDLVRGAGQMRDAIDKFIAKTDVINAKIVSLVSAVGLDSTDDEITKAERILKLSEAGAKQLNANTTNVLELWRSASTNNNTGFGNAVTQIFAMRKQQLELFAQEMEITQTQELHVLEMKCTTLTENLKIQTQFFDQMKTVMDLQQKAKEKEDEHHRELQKLENDHLEAMERTRVEAEKARISASLEREKAAINASLQQEQARLAKESACFKAQLDADVQRHAAEHRGSSCIAM